MDSIHVIDFEGNRKLGISEFGVVTLQNFAIASTFFQSCKNDFHAHLKYFLSLRRSGLLAAHSSQTEDNLLRHHWASPGRVKTFIGDDETLRWGPWIDTKLVYRKLFKGLRSYELDDLIGAFSLESNLLGMAEKYCPDADRNFHHALFDALAAAALIQNLGQHFSNLSPKFLVFLCQ
jgi:DNA polymerase III epsilon subunit-like protein